MISLDQIEGFDWDEGNREKNWLKHRVAPGECEDVFNLPLLLRDDREHSLSEPRHYMLGQTAAGRYLFIAFTVRTNRIRVISARDMSKKERAIHEKASP